MKLMTLLGVGALAAGTLGALPADAQRYDGGNYHGRYHGGDRFRSHGSYGYRGGYAYRGGYGFRGGYGPRYRHGGYYGRPRVVCRLRPGYYGPVRRCFRAY